MSNTGAQDGRETAFRPETDLTVVPVEIRLYGGLRDAVGTKSVSRRLTGDRTVRSMLDALCEDHPELRGLLFDEDGEIKSRVVVRRNQTTVTTLEAELDDGDTIAVATQIVGGAVLFYTPPQT